MTEVIFTWLMCVSGTGLFIIAEGSGGNVEDLVVNNWILKGGVAGVLLLIVMALVKGWFVPGYIHKAVVEKLKEVEAQNVGMVMAGGAQPCNEELVEHLKEEINEYKQEMMKFMIEFASVNRDNLRLQQIVDDFKKNQEIRSEVNKAKLLASGATASGNQSA